MAINEKELADVVAAWHQYAESSPARIDPADLVKKRDMKMYRGLGIVNAHVLAAQLVQDRSVASMEMTMGHLYERLLEAFGLKKVTNQEKKLPGFKGIDFVHHTAGELRLVNLKSGLSTSNGDITAQTATNLVNARDSWINRNAPDDNPLQQKAPAVIMVKAVARGASKRTTTREGILWLVGEAMWEYFGAGPNALAALSRAMGETPLNHDTFKQGLDRATAKTLNFLQKQALVDDAGLVRWNELSQRFP